MTEEQLDLLSWKPPAEIVPFPLHRSHGATAGAAKAIIDLDKPARTGRLNSIRVQTRKQMELIFGKERAEKIADDLISRIKTQIRYREIDRGVRRPDQA
ncbi:hypothetical protein [Rhizobium hainanense]|uniref:Uncharacterized protein n=1 Tax=Rhizobium hainanense TaxID=52131 RepID=A0A1C3UM70_9HYPH|nr:hypothetical protein [Rhizobium hainanense]SCB16596.1 hypothetical protein GA0061100_102642 [Rhizobium hainanense]